MDADTSDYKELTYEGYGHGGVGGEDEDQCLDPGRGSEAQGEGQHEEECEEVVLILDPGGAYVRVE